MNPVLKTGDSVCLIAVDRSQVRRGDILVFVRADGLEIIHRVIRLNPLQTKGDNCVNADPPVSADSPLYRAVSCRRGAGHRNLTAGGWGLWQFRWNQCRKCVLETAMGIFSRLAALNPLRVPASCLTSAAFGDRTVYYAGKRPVGWMDSAGWHWLGLARFYVQKPEKQA